MARDFNRYVAELYAADRGAQSRHSSWHTRHSARRISPPGEREVYPSTNLCNKADYGRLNVATVLSEYVQYVVSWI